MKNIFIDEAGRGPFAGPVCVGAVMSCQGSDFVFFEDFCDSKSCSAARREQLYQKIKTGRDQCVSATGRSSAKNIDQHGIVWALRWAVFDAVWLIVHGEKRRRRRSNRLMKEFFEKYTEYQLVIDGNSDFGLRAFGASVKTIINGDALHRCIGAASLVAKVERDRYMNKLAGMYPQYGFDKHKGYGTAFHRRMIVDYGLTRYHRVTYCIKTLQSTYLS